jgi:hypothetical protein
VWYVPHPWRRPSQAATFCCKAMQSAVVDFCDEHDDPWGCNYATLVYNEPLDEFGIVLRDRDPEYVLIKHCPWCAAKLPASRRDDWFAAMESFGIKALGAPLDDIPEPYRTAEWRLGAARKA